MQLLKEMIRTKKARQKATEAATEDLKNDFVNKILGYDVQKKYEEILGSKGLFSDNAMMELGIGLGGVALTTGAAGLGGADGGDATAYGLLGAGLAAAPAIHNAVRNPAYRVPMKTGRGLVGAIAAGAGAGTGSSLLLDALGLKNQPKVINADEGVMVRPAPGYVVNY